MLKLRQPAALKTLLYSQALERIGSFLLLILIATFLTQHYHMDDHSTFELAGSFGALSLAGYLVGGFLSDRLLGYRKSIVLGCCLLKVGYILLGFQKLHYLYAGLSFACVGNALFMPSLSGFAGDFFSCLRFCDFPGLWVSIPGGPLVARRRRPGGDAGLLRRFDRGRLWNPGHECRIDPLLWDYLGCSRIDRAKTLQFNRYFCEL